VYTIANARIITNTDIYPAYISIEELSIGFLDTYDGLTDGVLFSRRLLYGLYGLWVGSIEYVFVLEYIILFTTIRFMDWINQFFLKTKISPPIWHLY
jgi:hypothetical protein